MSGSDEPERRSIPVNAACAPHPWMLIAYWSHRGQCGVSVTDFASRHEAERAAAKMAREERYYMVHLAVNAGCLHAVR